LLPEDIFWRKLPEASSIIYNCPFDMIAKLEVVGVTWQSAYFSRTVVHCAPAADVSAARLRSPVPALEELFAAVLVEPLYVVTEEEPEAPAPLAVAVDRASVGGVVAAFAVA